MYKFVLLMALGALSPCLARAETAPKPRPIPSAEQDLGWLNRYLDAHAAGSRRVEIHRGPGLEFAALPQYLGKRIAVTLRDGREREGRLEHADGNRGRLRVRLAAGEYLFEFSRAEVARISGG